MAVSTVRSMLAWYMYLVWDMGAYLVCLSQITVLQKRLNIGSCRQRRMDSQFSDAKDLLKLEQGHSQSGAKCR